MLYNRPCKISKVPLLRNTLLECFKIGLILKLHACLVEMLSSSSRHIHTYLFHHFSPILPMPVTFSQCFPTSKWRILGRYQVGILGLMNSQFRPIWRCFAYFWHGFGRIVQRFAKEFFHLQHHPKKFNSFWYMIITQHLKITEKVSFNIASNVFILSGQQLIKECQRLFILASF